MTPCVLCRTGRITAWSLSYYLMSMVLAVGIGIGMSYAIRPGASKPFDNTSAAQAACLAKTASLVKTSS